MTTRPLRRIAAAAAIATSVLAAAGTASADGTIPYTWQGLDDAGNLESVECDSENTEYVLFVFTATRASSAEITINGMKSSMTKTRNGSFKYVWNGDVDQLTEASASYSGDVRGNPQLVISHGCPGDDQPPS